MGITKSAWAGASRARAAPRFSRATWTDWPKTLLAGEAKYTCSNTHIARRSAGGANRRDSTPASDSVTISPGSTSRTNSAPITSSATVSDATQSRPPGSLPSTSGRQPQGSRAASIRSGRITTSEKAPWSLRSVAASGSGVARCSGEASRWTITSVSDVVWKRRPCSAKTRFQASALTRLPLWPIATGPSTVVSISGWALQLRDPPAVE